MKNIMEYLEPVATEFYDSNKNNKGQDVIEEGNWLYFTVDSMTKIYKYKDFLSEEQKLDLTRQVKRSCEAEGIKFKQYRGPMC